MLQEALEKKGLEKFIPILEKISHMTFALGLLIELTIVIVEKSEYIILYEGLWFRLTFVLFGISLLTAKHRLRDWIWLFLFGIIGVISYRATGRNEIIRWIAFIWACQGKDMKKVFQVTFWYTLAGCGIIFLLSVFGIYGSILQEAVYRTEEAWTPGMTETRYCFGMGHPNAFHCMILVVTWLGVYCYYEKMKWYSYILLFVGHVVVYFFTDSKTGLLTAGITLVVTIFTKIIKNRKWTCFVGITILLLMVGISVYMAYISKDIIYHPILKKIDGLLSNRVLNLYYNTANHEGILETWSLWSSENCTAYFDLGIVRMFYWFGILPTIVYFICQIRLIWCSYKNRDLILIGILICITIYSVFEAHFISDYMGRNYILFWFGMYLSDMLGEEKR